MPEQPPDVKPASSGILLAMGSFGYGNGRDRQVVAGGKDTKPELIVRSLLHRVGVRFSLRRKDLPGKPDIVLPKYGAVVFVHGCFWHRHKGCKVATRPKTRTDFWQAKFAANVARDKRNQRDLKKAGWKVIVLWECQVMRDPFAAVEKVLKLIRPAAPSLDYDSLPDKRSIIKGAESRLQWNLGKRWNAEMLKLGMLVL